MTVHGGGDASLRIGLFAHRLAHRHPTGIARYIRELACALGEFSGEDNDISLMSTREADPPQWIPHTLKSRVLPWPRTAVQLAWCLGSGPRLERGVGPLDVVHLLQPFPPVRTAAPQVATVHDLFPFDHPDWYRPSERWTYRRSLKLIVERAVLIVVPSSYVADRAVSTLGIDRARIRVVPQGVTGAFAQAQSDEELAQTCKRFGLDPGSFAVGVGAVSTRKNVITLVRAAAELSNHGIPLVLIGPDGHGAEDVDSEIEHLGTAARVVRTGYLDDRQTAALVQAAAVLLHPTLGEGFGFVPLEAMVARTAVIAARISSIPEVVGEAAVLVDEPTKSGAWAQAIIELVGDPDRLQAVIAAGDRQVAQFTWERTARIMLDIYRDVAQR
jgi:glycosyltransferase involved in cell wall biosynthesis